MHRSVRVVGWVGLLVVIAGCSQTFLLRVSGSATEGVVFSLWTADPAPTPLVIRVIEVRVGEVSPSAPRKIQRLVWRLTGEAELQALTYGSTPAGLVTDMPARHLKTHCPYLVSVTVKARGGPQGTGGILFKIQDDGAVTPLSEEEASREAPCSSSP